MTTTAQFQRSVSRFTDYAKDLLRSDHHSFDDALSLFLDFFERDPVFSSIHQQLLSVPQADFDSWLKANEGQRTHQALDFPLDMEARIALMYELLRRIGSKQINILNFAFQFFRAGSNKVDLYIHAFNDGITRQLVREVLYRIEDASAEFPDDDRATIPPASIQIIHSATNVIQQSAIGNNITQNASNQNTTELTSLFDKLEQLIRAQHAANEAFQEYLEIIASARENATSQKPKRSVVKTLLGALPTAGDVMSITSSILAMLPAM